MFSRLTRRSGISIAITLLSCLLFLAINGAIAQEPPPDAGAQRTEGDLSVVAAVNSRINYQGVLEEGGSPVDGTRDFTFDFFTNDACSGVAVYSLVESGVPVEDGFFDVDVDVTHGVFHGEGVWLQVTVGSTVFACEEILPVPYALSLRPGATIVGEEAGTTFGDATLNVENAAPSYMGAAAGVFARTATGSAVRAESDAVGVYAASEFEPAVFARSAATAGLFQSDEGYGIRVNADGDDHWDHAGYFTANKGNGLFVTSTDNVGVRAESGDTAGLWQPSGNVGVAGIGEVRGVYGSGGTGPGVTGISEEVYGVYGESEGTDLADAGVYGRGNEGPGVYGISYGTTLERSYGGYFYSGNYRGIYASSDPSWYAAYFQNRGGSANAGVYIDGSLTASGSKSGYVVDLAENAGPEPLETGDVVVIVGASEPLLGEIPVVQVRRAAEAGSTAVIGVVDQPFVFGEPGQAEGIPHPAAEAALAATSTAVDEGGYASVVTLGAFKAVRVDASYGAIRPGDLLVSSTTPGHAMRADSPAPGAVIGKALEPLDAGKGTIAVMVTLQ
jgi:hypothetical protein